MSYPTYTRLPFSAYPQDPVADSYNAGQAEYGSQAGARNAYEAGQRRLAAQKAWEAQQKAAGQNTYANRVELEKELAANESEIRKLQGELGSMQNRWKDLDSMDRELAANRARIGDLANARAHQTDIINRRNDRNRAYETRMQWRWQEKQNRLSREADQKKQAQANIRRIIGEIEDLDMMMPYYENAQARQAADVKRARLVKELASYGVTYGGTQAPTANEGPQTADEWEIFRIQNTDKNGNWLSEDARDKYASRPQVTGSTAQSAKDGRNMKTTEEVKAAKAKREADKRDADAIAARYFGKIDIGFKQRWNAASPDAEIKKLKKFYSLENGLLVKKGG